MSSDRETTRIVRSWLEDGADTLPDRVLDAVLAELPATRQRRSWWQAWRNPFVTNATKLAMVAGVVVLSAAVGLGLYLNQPGLIGPQPTPTIEPTPSPSPLSFARVAAEGNVPAGTYVTDGFFPLHIEFSVPEGWQKWSVAYDGVGVMKHGAAPPAGSGFGFWIVRDVYMDPCDTRLRGATNPGPTVDHLAQALSQLENYQTTNPVDVALGGFSGKYLEITAPADLTGCTAPRLWRTDALGTRSVFGPSEHDRIWILDVDGTRLLVKMAYRPGTPESDVAELEQMVDSVRIGAPDGDGASTDRVVIGQGILEGRGWAATTWRRGDEICSSTAFLDGTSLIEESCGTPRDISPTGGLYGAGWDFPSGSPVIFHASTSQYVTSARLETRDGVVEAPSVSLAPVGLDLSALVFVFPPGSPTEGEIVLLNALGRVVGRHSV